jgi:hypothetical protein
MVLGAIRESLTSALHLVFWLAALVMLGGVVGSLVWREVPMRRAAPRRSQSEPELMSASAAVGALVEEEAATRT